MEQWRQERIRAEEARKRSAELALENLRNGRLWERYHKAMDTFARRYWEQRGVPRFFQDLWGLGWDNAHEFYVNGQPYITPTATIPVFSTGWQLLNIKHRLQNVPDNAGKYRYEITTKATGHPLFLCDPDKTIEGDVIAIEGEIKAMVTYVTLDSGKANVIGLPGSTLKKEDMAAQFANADRVTLVMDPGARVAAWELTKAIGREKCRVLIPPVKIDDGILAGHLTAREVRALLKNAVPAA